MTKEKKLLENPIISSMVVPVAIILVGSLIVFGVTKMLSTDRSYRDLVREMHSKTFGNRWVAAFELSKQIASSNIPEEDLDWLVDEMSQLYGNANDPRTRNFLVVAAGALKSDKGLPLIKKGLSDTDSNVKFHAITSLGNMDTLDNFDWDLLYPHLNQDDVGIQIATILTLSRHNAPKAQETITPLLNSPEPSVRYAAATALVRYKSIVALPVVNEILLLESEPKPNDKFTLTQVENLKMNILRAAKKNKWNAVRQTISTLVEAEKNLKVKTKAKELLILLNN
jgi:HEAT repeat protein